MVSVHTVFYLCSLVHVCARGARLQTALKCSKCHASATFCFVWSATKVIEADKHHQGNCLSRQTDRQSGRPVRRGRIRSVGWFVARSRRARTHAHARPRLSDVITVREPLRPFTTTSEAGAPRKKMDLPQTPNEAWKSWCHFEMQAHFANISRR